MEKQISKKSSVLISIVIFLATCVGASSFFTWELDISITRLGRFVSDDNAWDISPAFGIILLLCAALTIIFAAKRKRWSPVFLLFPAYISTWGIIVDQFDPSTSPGGYFCMCASIIGVIVGVVDIIKSKEWTYS